VLATSLLLTGRLQCLTLVYKCKTVVLDSFVQIEKAVLDSYVYIKTEFPTLVFECKTGVLGSCVEIEVRSLYNIYKYL
jgi:hypothetical protein